MRRIAAAGHVDNKFTEGNSQTGQEATDVSAEWLTDTQEEICRAIELAGLALDEGAERDQEQLHKAIVKMIQEGAGTITVPLANNAAATDIPGLDLGANVLYFEATVVIRRRTDSESVYETGTLSVLFDEELGAWEDPQLESSRGDAGTSFSMSENKIQSTTNDLAGSGYIGSVRYSNIKIVTK